jgi:hypothetical protein
VLRFVFLEFCAFLATSCVLCAVVCSFRLLVTTRRQHNKFSEVGIIRFFRIHTSTEIFKDIENRRLIIIYLINRSLRRVLSTFVSYLYLKHVEGTCVGMSIAE